MKPMLAHKYTEGQPLDFPVLVQPKLDGIRCIANIDKDGNVTLLSRTGKEILSLPSLSRYLSLRYKNICLDGELIIPEVKFEELCEIVKRKTPHKHEAAVEFIVFDVINDMPLEDRLGLVNPMDYVGHLFPKDEIQLYKAMHNFTGKGHEGMMIRTLESKYLPNRSYNLLKWKKFNEIGGKIVSIEDGKGKFKNLAAIAHVLTEEGVMVKAKFRFNYEFLAHVYTNKDSYVDKPVDIKYQNKTKYGMLRFPEIIRIREDLSSQ